MTSLSGYISSLFLTFSSISFQFLKNDMLRCATKFNFASKPWLLDSCQSISWFTKAPQIITPVVQYGGGGHTSLDLSYQPKQYLVLLKS